MWAVNLLWLTALQLKWNGVCVTVLHACIVVSGGSRYMPSSAGGADESGAAAKADPFTGAARYVPAGASTSTAGCQQSPAAYILVSLQISASFRCVN